MCKKRQTGKPCPSVDPQCRLLTYGRTRLAKILEKRNLAPSKLDEIKIKANILSSFVEKSEGGKEKVARAEAEL